MLEEMGIETHSRETDSDVAIVLGGLYEGPLVHKGRRVLYYMKSDWGSNSWPLYEFILSEYYDEMIDESGKGLDQIAMDVANRVRG